MRADEYFTSEWSCELPRLRQLLLRNGVARDDVDDVLQETATRLYRAWGRVFDGRPLRPLLTTIALNAARDHHRRHDHLAVPVSRLPEDGRVEAPGADRVALARLDVARTARALAALPESQRRTVLDAVSAELLGEQLGRHRAPASVRMARSRARRQLAAALELIASAVGIAVTGGRRAVSSSAAGATALVAAGVVAVSAVATSPASPAYAEKAGRQERSASTSTSHAGAAGGSSARIVVAGRDTGSPDAIGWRSSSGMPFFLASLLGDRVYVAGPQLSPCLLHLVRGTASPARCAGIEHA